MPNAGLGTYKPEIWSLVLLPLSRPDALEPDHLNQISLITSAAEHSFFFFFSFKMYLLVRDREQGKWQREKEASRRAVSATRGWTLGSQRPEPKAGASLTEPSSRTCLAVPTTCFFSRELLVQSTPSSSTRLFPDGLPELFAGGGFNPVCCLELCIILAPSQLNFALNFAYSVFLSHGETSVFQVVRSVSLASPGFLSSPGQHCKSTSIPLSLLDFSGIYLDLHFSCGVRSGLSLITLWVENSFLRLLMVTDWCICLSPIKIILASPLPIPEEVSGF